MTTELRPPGQGNGRAAPSFGRTVTLRCAQGQVFGRVCDNVHDFTVTVFHDHSIIIVTARVHKASDLKYMRGVCLSFQPEFIGNAVRPENFVDLD
jgi:hypothetical protein